MSGSPAVSVLSVTAAGIEFQNPIVLAAGTAAYGAELDGVVRLDRLGGLVTKAVSVEPRKGAPSPRVAEFDGGMINAIGLANPGLDEVRRSHLPWLAARLHRARVLVNVVGSRVEDFGEVVAGLGAESVVSAFELNVSCPNVKAGGTEFGADPRTLAEVVSRARVATERPLFVKLSPMLPDVARAAQVAIDAGANGITVINTIPGLVVDVESRRPALGFGSGGVSGRGLLPVGVLAVSKIRRALGAGAPPLIGLGGVSEADHALQYLIAGATLVGVGTAALLDPRAPERIVGDLQTWCERHGVRALADVIGTLEWPT